jgi:hypothetical protein
LVLDTFRRILVHYEVNVFLPSTMRTIKAAKLDMDRYSYCNEFFDFDSRLVDTNDTRFKGSVGSFLCILQLFAELLLTVEYEDLILERYIVQI